MNRAKTIIRSRFLMSCLLFVGTISSTLLAKSNSDKYEVSTTYEWSYVLPSLLTDCSQVDIQFSKVFSARNMALPTALVATSDKLYGSVFIDVNQNGIWEDNVEVGAEGVTVTAYVEDNTPVGSTMTIADGSFELTPTVLTGKYRLEFTGLPADWEYSVVSESVASSVAFVQRGGDPVTVGVFNPYCFSPDADKTMLVTPCFVDGDPLLGGTSANGDALIRWDYNNSGIGASPVLLAHASEIGATWGVAYDPLDDAILAASFLKRHVGLGPDGLGAIYAVGNATSATPDAPTIFIDLATNGVDVGSSVIPANRNLQMDAGAGPSRDLMVYENIGKVGLGDLDLSDDRNTLYTVNLYNRSIVRIDMTTNPVTVIDETNIVMPTCTGGEFRPFGLKYHNGKLYIGGVCDGSTGGIPEAYVLEWDFSTFTTVLSFPMDYQRPGVTGNCVGDWNGWVDTWPTSSTVFCGGIIYSYPQPMLGDIEFDANGDMILAFLDRFGHQTGRHNFKPSGTGKITGFSSGDILRAGLVNGNYVIEDNSISGNVGPTVGFEDVQGPNGGEFYWGDRFTTSLPEPNQTAGTHSETVMGGLTLLKSEGEVVVNAFDPVDGSADSWLSGGPIFLDNTTGEKNDAYAVYLMAHVGTWGKSSGLGDLEHLSLQKPVIEIGNRVWFDPDGDGIQDAYEPGIMDATVQLRDAVTNNLIGSVMTDRDGNFSFNSTDFPELLPNADYILRVSRGDNAVDRWVSGSLATITTTDAGGNVGNSDLHDSDAVAGSNNFAEIYFTTGDNGQSNHTYDFGFTGTPNLGVDRGDNPQSYRTNNVTNNANDGPTHTIIAGYQLGDYIDSDGGSPASTLSNDDDREVDAFNFDDEDGVRFLNYVSSEEWFYIEVKSSQPGYLNAWLDFNANGTYDIATEQIATDFFLDGIDTIAFMAPIITAAEEGLTGARFRFSMAGGDGPIGSAASGEVEDYAVELLEFLRNDFGDAISTPAKPYPVSTIDDGARHVLPSPSSLVYYLGSGVDYDDITGNASVLADGDDSETTDPDSGDDEDGVFFYGDIDNDGVPDLVPGTFQSLDVIAQGPNSGEPAGFLNAWIDFNQDGDWDDEGEQIFNDFQLQDNNTNPTSLAGRNWALTYDVPGDAVPGITYARFRYTSLSGDAQTPTGQAYDGEVEDYIVNISDNFLPHRCDNKYAFFMDGISEIVNYRIDYSKLPIQMTPLPVNPYNGRYNGLGFNPKDGYLYVINNDNILVRIAQNGAAQELGVPINSTTGAFYSGGTGTSGTGSPDGYYYRFDQNSKIQKHDIENLRFDVLPGQSIVNDIAFHPTDGYMYGFEDSKVYVHDPEDGSVVTTIPVTGAINNGMRFGATFMDGRGKLYGLFSGVWYVINLDTDNSIEPVGVYTNPTVSVDAASCNCGIIMEKLVSSTEALPGDTINYTFKVIISSGTVSFSNITLGDSLGWGGEFIDTILISVDGGNTYENRITSYTNGTASDVKGGVEFDYIGKNKFTIYDMDLPSAAGTEPAIVYFSAKVKLPEIINADSLGNQAYLTDLPTTVADTVYSDSPETSLGQDSTFLRIIPSLSIGNRVWEEASATGITETPDDAGIDNVIMSLYQLIDTSMNNQLDTVFVAHDTTSNGGYYLFPSVMEGNYIVAVDSSNFRQGGSLYNLASLPGVTLANDDTDLTDDGKDDIHPTYGVLTDSIQLSFGAEPTLEFADSEHGTGGQDDEDSNLTVDFGFKLACAISMTATPSACNASDNSYTISALVTYQGLAGDSIEINGQRFEVDQSGSETFVVGPLTSDGNMVSLTANDPLNTSCASNAVQVQAPASCMCMLSMTATPSACNASDNSYTISAQVTYNGLAGDSIEINGQRFEVDQSGSETFVVGPLTSDGNMVSLTANDPLNTSCTSNTVQVQAPASCMCMLSMTATPSACNASDNSYTISAQVTYGGLAGDSIEINGQRFEVDQSGSETFVVGPLTSDGNMINLTASDPLNTSCTSNTVQVQAPAACGCMLSMTATPSACNVSDNSYTISAQVTYNGLAGDSIEINGQRFEVDQSGSETFVVGPLTSDGNMVSLTANDPLNTSCTSNTVQVQAPAACGCMLSMTATPSACNVSDNSYTISAQVTYNGLAGDSIEINGQRFEVDQSGSETFVVGPLTSDGNTLSLTASDPLNTSCTSNAVQVQAPAACGCMLSMTATPSACDASDNSYTISAQVTYNGLAGDSIEINGQRFEVDQSGSETFVVGPLTSDGNTLSLRASDPLNASCTSSDVQVQAPEDCLCTMSVTAVPTPCDPTDDTYDVTVEVTYDNLTGSDISINGNTIAATPSPMSVQLSDLLSDGALGIQVMVSDPTLASCSATTTYDAPAACVPECMLSAEVDISCSPTSSGFYDLAVNVSYIHLSGNSLTIDGIQYTVDGTSPDRIMLPAKRDDGNSGVTVGIEDTNDSTCSTTIQYDESGACTCDSTTKCIGISVTKNTGN